MEAEEKAKALFLESVRKLIGKASLIYDPQNTWVFVKLKRPDEPEIAQDLLLHLRMEI